MEWQPIETVPKDGTKLLLGRFEKACRNGKYGYTAVDKWSFPGDESGWVGWGKFNMHHWPPTHWMPLPEPPKDDA